MSSIKYIDRETGHIQEEKVAGEKYLKWLYNSPMGMGLLELIVKKGFFSKIYGIYQDSSLSKRKIAAFIKDYEIDMEDFKHKPHEYKSFNDFFFRELKNNARSIEKGVEKLIAGADGRLLAYENIDIKRLLQVKGSIYNLEELIGSKNIANNYQNGTCIVIRLCPLDYHRFHFPDSGTPEQAKEIKGSLYSVNPIALSKRVRIYCENKRQLTVFHSDNYDDMLLLEIGATCVGSIVQTFTPNRKVAKGEEKGYFKFGGSTVIMFIKKDKVKIDEDLLENTNNGYETKVKMGMAIGKII